MFPVGRYSLGLASRRRSLKVFQVDEVEYPFASFVVALVHTRKDDAGIKDGFWCDIGASATLNRGRSTVARAVWEARKWCARHGLSLGLEQ